MVRRRSPNLGGEGWAVVECCGCRTRTFLHERWFSEDTVEDQGPEPIVHRTVYPPAPTRKMPEWSHDQFIMLDVPPNDAWVFKLHQDVYAAIGLGSLHLSAMGVRAIVDHIVTWKAGDVGAFLEPVREHIESSESFVIQGRRPDSLGGRRCGRARIADAMTEVGCAIRAI